jgi:hypothetical protein
MQFKRILVVLTVTKMLDHNTDRRIMKGKGGTDEYRG